MWGKAVVVQIGGRMNAKNNVSGLMTGRKRIEMMAMNRRNGCSAFSTLSTTHLSKTSCPQLQLSQGTCSILHPFQCGYCCPPSLKPTNHFQGQQTDNRHYFSTSSGNDRDAGDTQQSTSDEIQIPGAQKGNKKLAIIFTCTQCNTRSAKQFTERAYKYGVVIATCPGCKNKHLIADNLGFFSDEEGSWNIETAMAKLGKTVKVATTDNVLELSLEDIYTKEAIEEAIDRATSGNPKPDSSNG